MYKLTNTTSIIRLSDNAFIPKDERNTDYQVYLQWVAQGNTPEPIPSETPQQSIARLDNAIEAHIQSVIESLGYESLDRLVGVYSDSPNATWKAEALGAKNWATALWETALQIEQDATNGTRPIPTEQELIAELPKLSEFIVY